MRVSVGLTATKSVAIGVNLLQWFAIPRWGGNWRLLAVAVRAANVPAPPYAGSMRLAYQLATLPAQLVVPESLLQDSTGHLSTAAGWRHLYIGLEDDVPVNLRLADVTGLAILTPTAVAGAALPRLVLESAHARTLSPSTPSEPKSC